MLRLQVADATEVARALRLAEAIVALEPIAPERSPLVLCNGPFGGLYLRFAGRTGIMMQVEVDADISDEDVACGLPQVVLTDAWRLLPSGPAEVIIDGCSLTIRAARSRVQLPIVAEEWAPPVQPAGTRIAVAGDPFWRALSATIGVREYTREAGRGPTWPTTCLRLRYASGRLRVEGASSWAAVRCELGAQCADDAEAEALLPYDMPRVLRALPPRLAQEISLFFDEDWLWALYGKMLLRLPTVGGQFPDLDRFFSEESVHSVRTNARDLLQVVGALAPVVRTHFAPAVLLSGEDGLLKFDGEGLPNDYERYYATATIAGDLHHGQRKLTKRRVPFPQLAAITRGLSRVAEGLLISLSGRFLRIFASGPYGVELQAVTVADEEKEQGQKPKEDRPDATEKEAPHETDDA